MFLSCFWAIILISKGLLVVRGETVQTAKSYHKPSAVMNSHTSGGRVLTQEIQAGNLVG